MKSRTIPKASSERAVRPLPVLRQGSKGPTCKGTRKDGKPCGMTPMPSGLCVVHDPSISEELKLKRRQMGGLAATARRLLPDDFPRADFSKAESVRQLAERTTDAVARGEMTPSQANSVTGLLGIGIRLAELEADLKLLALEAEAKDGRKVRIINAEEVKSEPTP